MSVTEAILAHVGRPFPVEPVRTLDAIHVIESDRVGAAVEGEDRSRKGREGPKEKQNQSKTEG